MSQKSRRMLAGFMSLGIRTDIIRQMLQVRKVQHISIARLMRARKIASGQLVVGTDRHVYFIDVDNNKHWVCSSLLLDACNRPNSPRRVSDDKLKKLPDGPPIATLEEAKVFGLCQ